MTQTTNLGAYTSAIADCIKNARFLTKEQKQISAEEATGEIEKMIQEVKVGKKKLLFIGNGGSATVAAHFAEDFSKMANIRGLAFNDGPLLTCLANDYSFEECFQKAIEIYADAGDVLFAISSSGKSPNIRNGAEAATKLGCKVITLSGFAEGNPLSGLGNINIHTPSTSYGIVESSHSIIIHAILDHIVGK
ncbi:MAG: SIS domain-containing protein [bacterium]|nr:SIS domain-containing protein [bacterium]